MALRGANESGDNQEAQEDGRGYARYPAHHRGVIEECPRSRRSRRAGAVWSWGVIPSDFGMFRRGYYLAWWLTFASGVERRRMIGRGNEGQ